MKRRTRLASGERYLALWRYVAWLPLAFYAITVVTRMLEGAGGRAFFDLGRHGTTLAIWSALSVVLAFALRRAERVNEGNRPDRSDER